MNHSTATQPCEPPVQCLMDQPVEISDEELVEAIYEFFDVTAAEAIERLARFSARKARKSMGLT